MKQKDYHLVECKDRYDLMNMVNKYMSIGYIPLGGVSDIASSLDGNRYMQAMLYEPKKGIIEKVKDFLYSRRLSDK